MLLVLRLIEHFVHEILSNDLLNVTHDGLRRCLGPCVNVRNHATPMWLS